MLDVELNLKERTMARKFDRSISADRAEMEEALNLAYDTFTCRLKPHIRLTVPRLSPFIDGRIDPMYILMHSGPCQRVNATKVSLGLPNLEVVQQLWSRTNTLAGAMTRMTAFGRGRFLRLNTRRNNIRLGESVGVSVSNRLLFAQEQKEEYTKYVFLASPD